MKRLMIVDDSSVIRKVVKHVLATPDLAVVEASNGNEALSMCAEQMPDILVCDVTLTDMGIVEFIGKVKMMAGQAQPVIFINHHEMNIAVLMKAKRAGASGYILKPFNRPTLMRRFHNIDMAA